jgi:hypothetical protein
MGLFSRAQAVANGYSVDQITRRLRSGEWQRVLGQAFALPGQTVTGAVLAAAVHLSVPGSVLAGPSAALLWRLPAQDSLVYLWSARRPQRPPDGVRFICDPLDRLDVQRAEGILVTSQARTVFDCLRTLPEDRAISLLDRALQRGWIAMPDLVRRVRGHAGRRDAPRLVRLMRSVADGSRSSAERLAACLLRSAGIAGWEANAPIYDAAGLIGCGDLVFRTARLVV